MQQGDVLDRLLANVPGFMSRRELELLFTLAADTQSQVVELGTFAGLSTIALCLGAQVHSIPVTTIDLFIFSDTEMALEQLRNNLTRFEVSPRVIHARSWEAVDQVEGPIGLLVIDADHAQASVDKDVRAWSPRVSPEGVIVFDDYANDRYPGVSAAADEWAADAGWHAMEQVDKLQVFRRQLTGQRRPAPSRLSGLLNRLRQAPEPEVAAASTWQPAGPLEARASAYLTALGEHNLDGCLEFFAEDADLLFLRQRFHARDAIAAWHRARFDAGLQVLRVGGVAAQGDRLRVDTVVSSRVLERYRVGRVPVRAEVRLNPDDLKIKEIRFGVGNW